MTVKEDYKVMTIKDLKEQLNSETYAEIEVYRFKDKSKRIHTDFIEFVDEWNEDMLLVNEWSYELMDEDKYSHTILINDAMVADFDSWYGDKDAKVLVIFVR